MSTTVDTRERQDLLETLAMHRSLLRRTVAGLDDAQAALTPTASTLCLGGIIRHVAAVEAGWARFIVDGAPALEPDEAAESDYADNFRFGSDESLAEVLAGYEEVAATTDRLVAELPDLDADRALPPAPWFQPGKRWSARRVLTHIVAETAQHAGHADIIRESIDGARTMG